MENGKRLLLGIGVYLVIKGILNCILGFSFANLVSILVAVVVTLLMLRKIPYVQYIVAIWLVLVALIHMPDNIRYISSNAIYLVEGLLDIAAAVLLVVDKNIKAYFANDNK